MAKTEEGAWIDLDETPSEVSSKGLPEEGDIVVVQYEGKNPATGSARRVHRTTETAKTVYKSREDGASFIFSPNF